MHPRTAAACGGGDDLSDRLQGADLMIGGGHRYETGAGLDGGAKSAEPHNAVRGERDARGAARVCGICRFEHRGVLTGRDGSGVAPEFGQPAGHAADRKVVSFGCA